MDIEARPGDMVVVDPMHLGDPQRTGEVLEVLGLPEVRHYRVRWDDGHESLFYPGSTAHAVHLGRS